MEQIDLMISI